MAGLSWRKNAIGDLIGAVEDKVFWRIAPSVNGGYTLWFIRRSDHALGGMRNCVGWFASQVEAKGVAKSKGSLDV